MVGLRPQVQRFFFSVLNPLGIHHIASEALSIGKATHKMNKGLNLY